MASLRKTKFIGIICGYPFSSIEAILPKDTLKIMGFEITKDGLKMFDEPIW